MPAPNFFIVGAPKSGTTSLSRYLGQHPDVLMADPKEPFHFGRDLQSKPTWHIRNTQKYLSLFDLANPKRRIGEATVWYMYSKQAAGEIYRFCPDAKIIMMLRKFFYFTKIFSKQYILCLQKHFVILIQCFLLKLNIFIINVLIFSILFFLILSKI